MCCLEKIDSSRSYLEEYIQQTTLIMSLTSTETEVKPQEADYDPVKACTEMLDLDHEIMDIEKKIGELRTERAQVTDTVLSNMVKFLENNENVFNIFKDIDADITGGLNRIKSLRSKQTLLIQQRIQSNKQEPCELNR